LDPSARQRDRGLPELTRYSYMKSAISIQKLAVPAKLQNARF